MPNEPPASVTEGLPTQWSPSPNGPAATPAPDPADFASPCPMAPSEASPVDGTAPDLSKADSDILGFITGGRQHSGLTPDEKANLVGNGCVKP